MPPEPFAHLTRKVRWQARVHRWRRTLLRPLRPTRIRPDRDGPPHLLLVGIDTLRADHLGCYGYRQPTSPNLDQLAGRGTLFADVTAPAPWTLPSFAGALTGVMPGRHGGYLGGPMRNMDTQPPQRLAPGVPTLAGHLRRLGYRTAAFYSNQFFAFGLAESFGRHEYHNLPAGDIVAIGCDWIRRHADRPLFCFLLLNDPHEPTTPPTADLAPFLPRLTAAGVSGDAPLLGRYARWGEGDALPLGRASHPLDKDAEAALAVKLAVYDATIHQVDREIGRLQAFLDRHELAANTLVSVFADHGEEFLDHAAEARRWAHDPRGLYGIGHGQSHFQELLHVPWTAWGPGVPAGVRHRTPVSLLDLAPTLLDWLGLPLLAPGGGSTESAGGVEGPSLCGRTLADRLMAPREPGADERLILAEAIAYGPDLVALRRGRWKMIAHRDGRPLALYDLQDDPDERRDRRDDDPDVLAGLLAELDAWRRGGGGATGSDEGTGHWSDLDATVRNRLKDLGYSE